MNAKPAIFSFFSGAGFLDLGFEISGYDIVLVNELFTPFLEAYQFARKNLDLPHPQYGYANFSIEDYLKPTHSLKLSELIQDARSRYPLVGFIGGPPCPDFSIGGKNRGSQGEKGKLSETYIELICQYKPDFFLFENVKGLWKTQKHKFFYDYLKSKLYDAGYILTERSINAIEYGVPQDRERIILIGFTNDLIPSFSCKSPKHYSIMFPWQEQTQYDISEVFAADWPTVNQFQENSVREFALDDYLELTVEYWFQHNNVLSHANSKHFFKPRQGKKRMEIIQEGDDSRKSFKRLHRWRYSPTACYGNNEVHLHPYQIRRISVAEALALQSLPKEYFLPESMSLSNMFKTIGNGVPYLAALGLAKSILSFLDSLSKDSELLVKLEPKLKYEQLEIQFI